MSLGRNPCTTLVQFLGTETQRKDRFPNGLENLRMEMMCPDQDGDEDVENFLHALSAGR